MREPCIDTDRTLHADTEVPSRECASSPEPRPAWRRRIRVAGMMGLLLTGALAVASAIVPRWQVASIDRGDVAPSVSDGAASQPQSPVDDAPASPADAWLAVGGATTMASGTAIGSLLSPVAMLGAPRLGVVPMAFQAASACRWSFGQTGRSGLPLPEAACGPSLLGMAAAAVPAPGPHGASFAVAGNGGAGVVPLAFSAIPLDAAPAIQAAHPRMLLDAATLARMRADVAAGTPAWNALKATCDAYVGGTVNYPTQNQYPNKPNVGSGYQGEEYTPVLFAEAMCYQVLKGSNPSAAQTYGNIAVDVLMKMSTPYSTASGNQGWNPCYDDGYGIRNYGVGFGLGYDWVYDLLTPAQRSQIYTTANAWITAWEQPGGCADFVFVHPMSNYYAGYFHAKAAIAIGTYGDNPSAPAEWNDWYGNQYAQRVQPYYARHLGGGGWLEGYANYAPPAIRNMSLPMREVKTATGVDLVHASAPFPYPLDSAVYAMHFTWPSRAYFDDRDTNHANGTAVPPVGTTQFGMFQQLLGALTYWGSPYTAVFNQYTTEVNTATNGYNPSPAWLIFLDDVHNVPTEPVNALPLSYLASGIGMVAARSDWTTSASWMSFRAGPHIENPQQGEEGFDQGSLALARGNTPLLVNTFGWMVHEPNGASDENLLFADLFNDFDGTIYHGNRQIYNIFYTRQMSGSTVLNRYGQMPYTQEAQNVSTKISAYEDRDGYVYVQATGLADMYRAFPGGPAVSGWTRQVVYLRPNRFIVYDRTVSGGSGYDQFMAWHFPAAPAAASAAAGENRIDVTYNGTYAGAMTTVLPASAALTTIPLYPTSNPVKVWQVQVRPPNTAVAQQWLTVFDMSASSSSVATVTPVTVNQGSVVGITLSSAAGTDVVLQSSATAGLPVGTPISYVAPAQHAHHVITELAPNTAYSVVATANGANVTVAVSAGGTFNSSANGVLDFYVDASGAVQSQPPATLTAPVSDLPVPGYPTPYKP